jgi:hypothetical protein
MRWYDQSLGRFIQPDTLVPNPGYPGDLDRYSYARNSPLRYRDPTGHWSCGDQYDPGCAESPQELAQYQIMVAGYQPDSTCLSDTYCNASFQTFVELIATLGRVPTLEEILYITAQAEYGPYITYEGADTMGGVGLEALGQEGLARNFYEACGYEDPYCTGSQLYRFMSGYEPWFGNTETSAERTAKLLNQLTRTDNRDALLADVQQILSYKTAFDSRWTEGSMPGEPWQWSNVTRPPNSLGYRWPAEAIGYITLTGGYFGDYFWVLSANQDWYYNHPPK